MVFGVDRIVIGKIAGRAIGCAAAIIANDSGQGGFTDGADT
jgi:hypothetical protein